MTKTRRLAHDEGVLKRDPLIWELVYIFWDKAENWSDRGDDWHRLDVPYPDPIWRTK